MCRKTFVPSPSRPGMRFGMPMPRLTISPGRSSCAARAAIVVLTSPRHRESTSSSTYRCGVWIDSGSSSPTGTISPTSAIVTRAAVAINGLKLRAVRRYQRLPSSSPRAAYTSATSAWIGRLEHVRDAVDDVLLLALGKQRAGADRREEAGDAGSGRADGLGERPLRHERRLDLAGVHRRDGLRVRGEVRRDATLDPSLAQQLPEPTTRLADVVRDDRQLVGVGAVDEGVDERERRADEPEPPTITVSPERIADTASSGSTGPFAIDIPHVPFVADQAESLQRLYAKAGLRHRSRRLAGRCTAGVVYMRHVLATRSPSRWGVTTARPTLSAVRRQRSRGRWQADGRRES